MAESRIEELRRRVEQDPASIAFAQLAEEYRRSGAHAEAVDVCRAGLARHPGYSSARVTLGRALLELGQVDAARHELERVVREAPDNLIAIRTLADLHQRADDAPFARAGGLDGPLDPSVVFPDPWLDAQGPPEPPLDLDLAIGTEEERFARALQALDALELDPGPPFVPDIPFEPAEFDIPAVLGEDQDEDLAMAAPPVAELPTAEPRPPVTLAAHPAISVLERWLEAIAADRASRRASSGTL